jgi:hypothetical protein
MKSFALSVWRERMRCNVCGNEMFKNGAEFSPLHLPVVHLCLMCVRKCKDHILVICMKCNRFEWEDTNMIFDLGEVKWKLVVDCKHGEEDGIP